MDLRTFIPAGVWPGYERERGTYVLANAEHRPAARRRGQRLLEIGGRIERQASGSRDRAETSVITPHIAKRVWRRGEKASTKLAWITTFSLGVLLMAWLVGLGWLGAWAIYGIYVLLYTHPYKIVPLDGKEPKKPEDPTELEAATEAVTAAASKRLVVVQGAGPAKKKAVNPDERQHIISPPNWRLPAIVAAVIAVAGLVAGFTTVDVDLYWLLQAVFAPAWAARLIRAYGWETVVEMDRANKRKVAPISVAARKASAGPEEDPLPQQITIHRATPVTEDVAPAPTTIEIEIPEAEQSAEQPVVQTIRRQVFVEEEDPGELSGTVDLDETDDEPTTSNDDDPDWGDNDEGPEAN